MTLANRGKQLFRMEDPALTYSLHIYAGLIDIDLMAEESSYQIVLSPS